MDRGDDCDRKMVIIFSSNPLFKLAPSLEQLTLTHHTPSTHPSKSTENQRKMIKFDGIIAARNHPKMNAIKNERKSLGLILSNK